MFLLDFLLNLIALLLWLNWRGMGFQHPASYRSSLLHTLRSAVPGKPRRWSYLVVLAVLLLLRAPLYWQLGSSLHWVARLPLGVLSVPFRSDNLQRMLVYSAAHFLLILVVFYSWLLLLSIWNRTVPDSDPWQRLIRLHLGWLECWPVWLKLATPILSSALLWLLLHPLLSRLALLPPATSLRQPLLQGLVLGLAVLLSTKYLLLGLLGLYLVTSYIHFGTWTFLEFATLTGKNLLHPLQWMRLRIGRFDFSPLAAMAMVWFGTKYGEILLMNLFERIPR
ncbi:MAG: hypothetical protein QOF48_2330 [Verrucomicrobiota bacterium]|jgi:hypothetical protein